MPPSPTNEDQSKEQQLYLLMMHAQGKLQHAPEDSNLQREVDTYAKDLQSLESNSSSGDQAEPTTPTGNQQTNTAVETPNERQGSDGAGVGSRHEQPTKEPKSSPEESSGGQSKPVVSDDIPKLSSPINEEPGKKQQPTLHTYDPRAKRQISPGCKGACKKRSTHM
jgi:hypothetical protein